MKKIHTALIFSMMFLGVIYSQQGMWVQTAGTPEGSGVTDMVIRQSNQHIFVTTGSFNWPNGDMGGVRRSMDDGTTWENLWDVYIARTIIEGVDGNLYASIWPYPQNEGLYRSTDDGNTWGNPLVSVPSGDNIFSIALNPAAPNQTIFAGTRSGPLRSTDNGASWAPANNGIPPNSWVRDIEVDSGSGIVAAATTNGLFISTDNGDMWQQATGINAGDTVVTLFFDNDFSTDRTGSALMTATSDGHLYISDDEQLYLNCAIVLTFFDLGESNDIVKGILYALNSRRHYSSSYPRGSSSGPLELSSGGIQYSSDNGVTWTVENEGLPNNPKTSAMIVLPLPGGNNLNSGEEINLFVGLYENANGGAKIYKRTDVVSDVNENLVIEPDNYFLQQNYPNPFNPSTSISFSTPEESFVRLEIFNSIGEKVSTLVSENLVAGNYKYMWDANEFSTGIYFYKITSGNFSETKKMILLK